MTKAFPPLAAIALSLTALALTPAAASAAWITPIPNHNKLSAPPDAALHPGPLELVGFSTPPAPSTFHLVGHNSTGNIDSAAGTLVGGATTVGAATLDLSALNAVLNNLGTTVGTTSIASGVITYPLQSTDLNTFVSNNPVVLSYTPPATLIGNSASSSGGVLTFSAGSYGFSASGTGSGGLWISPIAGSSLPIFSTQNIADLNQFFLSTSIGGTGSSVLVVAPEPASLGLLALATPLLLKRRR